MLTYQANYIMQILACVDKENAVAFKKKVVSAELYGGSGSVIDICISEKERIKSFFCKFTNCFLQNRNRTKIKNNTDTSSKY